MAQDLLDRMLDSIKDPDRLARLQQTGLLDSPPEHTFDRLTRLAATILHAPIALVVLIDAERQFFKSTYGPEPWSSRRETSLLYSFCQHQVASGQPLVITDAHTHPLVWNNPAVSEAGVVAYVGMPLVTSEGYVLGSFCVIDTQPRDWRQEEVATLRDLAASVMTEIELRMANREIRQLLQARDEFLSASAHELKTPLVALVGAIRLLQDAAPSRQRAHAGWQKPIYVIEKATQRLLNLIDTLVDLSYLQAGQLCLWYQPINLCQLARRVVADLQPTLRHQVELTCVDEALIVEGDERRLALVLDNLLQNAIKYSPRGGAITVRIARRESEACMTVCDHGIGIPEADQVHLFERFYRASNVDHSTIGGMGVGLYLVQEIVTRHGGRVEVESVEGQGSIFTVCLSLHSRAD